MHAHRGFFLSIIMGALISSCTNETPKQRSANKVSSGDIENLSSRRAKKLSTENIDALSKFIKQTMDDLLIPGAALAIVQDGNIVIETGFGAKELGGDPITPHTRFLAASTTKGLTTLLLAKAVELGLAEWDDPVIKHYPEFKIADPQLTAAVQIRHLVCACTGLSRMDLDWTYNNDSDTPSTRAFDHLAQMQPTTPLGEAFQYSNQLAAASGFVAGKIFYPNMEIGAAYDRAMQTYIFDPLGMDETTFDIQMALSGDVATPYAYDLSGKIAAIEQTETRGFNHAMGAFRPTGGAWTNVHDMIKYVRNEIELGVDVDGTRLFSRDEMLERRKPNVLAAPNRYYGMGFYIEDFSGVEVVRHSGSMRGYRAEVIVIPDANVGAVIMSNGRNGYGLVRTFTRRLVEELYDGREVAIEQVASAKERHLAEIETRKSNFLYPVPENIKSRLASAYSSPKLGNLDVQVNNGSVYFDTGLWGMSMAAQIQDDGQVIMSSIEPGIPHEFNLGETDGGLSTLTIVSGQNSYTFTEMFIPE